MCDHLFDLRPLASLCLLLSVEQSVYFSLYKVGGIYGRSPQFDHFVTVENSYIY